MKIAAVVITSNRAEIIGDALESALWCDFFVVIDLGMDLETRRIFKEKVGQKAIYCESDPSLPTASWRNLGLEVAHRFHCDYAIQLDTDERLLFDRDVFNHLDPEVEVWSVKHLSERYSKERIFKLPVKGSFVGHVHETWTGDSHGLVLDAFFDELPKSEEQITSRFPEMEKGLKEQWEKDQDNVRWPFYLGLIARAKSDWVMAADYFSCAVDAQTTTPDQAAMSYYYLSEAAYHLKEMSQRVRLYAKQGFLACPGIAENAFALAMFALEDEDPLTAIVWSNIAISQGLASRSPYAIRRMGQCELFALWEGPFIVKRDAMLKMGMDVSEIEKTIEIVSRRGK